MKRNDSSRFSRPTSGTRVPCDFARKYSDSGAGRRQHYKNIFFSLKFRELAHKSAFRQVVPLAGGGDLPYTALRGAGAVPVAKYMNQNPTSEIDLLAERLVRDGWFVSPAFVDAGLSHELLREAEMLWRGGGFRKAGVGRGADFRIRPDVRGDYVHWPEAGELPAADRLLQAYLEPLRQQINARSLLGLLDFEGHYAVYPPGTYYARHVDRFPGARNRVVSVALYLNHAWQPVQGGALRLYEPDGKGGERQIDIMPESGTLVCFISEEIAHEVRETHRERFSFTGWFRVRAVPRS